QPLLDDLPAEVEVRLRGGREADLDLLHPEPDEQLEEAPLPRAVHRVDEGLVPVTEVGRAPDRRTVEHDVRPRPVLELDGVVRAVLTGIHGWRSPSRGQTSPGECGST